VKASISISQPCHENWQGMTPTTNGRHCAACQKVVVDFTQKTDAELLAYLRQHRGGLCGRFNPAQLARPLHQPAAKSVWRTWLAAAAAVWGLREAASEMATAQRTGTGQHEVAPSTTPDAIAARSASVEAVAPNTICGKVTDRQTGDPMPGVTVLIKGTQIGVSTMDDGSFTLQVPAEAINDSLLVQFHSVGYITTERAVDATQARSEVHTAMALSNNELMGDLGVAFPWCSPRGWWWRVRNVFSR
jgi:hypothetical protein